jgi:hypothetical protein
VKSYKSIVRRVYPELIAHDLVALPPMEPMMPKILLEEIKRRRFNLIAPQGALPVYRLDPQREGK